ncbi:DUF3052 domain-containing protein [Nocardioides panacis]|uniref:DUF3052 domain-containing protein n=1 Tax=Nocardioides panacis TaxID=2849501 RepID=A0A975Y172_9ACTN|nr:DUF3052 domain-containing protein [Nocardioides panacis]
MRGVSTHGYSGTPLVAKLGLKPGLTVYVDGGPDHVGELLAGATYTTRLPRRPDVTLLFSTSLRRLEQRLPVVLERTAVAGTVWVCWPKKASRVPTDLDERVVREVGLATGFVDVKVCAVDATWSGLKFVRRLRDR